MPGGLNGERSSPADLVEGGHLLERASVLAAVIPAKPAPLANSPPISHSVSRDFRWPCRTISCRLAWPPRASQP